MSDYDYNEEMGNEFLDLDTSDAQEPMCVSEGEYQIRVTGFAKDSDGNITRVAESGNKYFIVSFDIPSEEFSKSFNKFYGVPGENDDPKTRNSKAWQIKLLKKAFGLPEEGGLNYVALIGREGYAMLGIKEDPEYGEQNYIKKLISGA